MTKNNHQKDWEERKKKIEKILWRAKTDPTHVSWWDGCMPELMMLFDQELIRELERADENFAVAWVKARSKFIGRIDPRLLLAIEQFITKNQKLDQRIKELKEGE